jgi:superfamily II DNA or RNA helicase
MGITRADRRCLQGASGVRAPQCAHRERDAALTTLRSNEPGERLVLATGRYLGEGFDYAPLDTLFLTLPISWKGTLAQYVGRLHREHADKRDVLVVDYSDLGVPMLARMAGKRVAGYLNLGYVVEQIGVRREHGPANTVASTLD